jgi:uncharacterized DUF497 family protein
MIELTDLAMEFDWSLFVQGAVSQEEAVQGFEDGFSLRFIPSGRRFLSSVRFFCLGSTLSGRRVFIVYTTSGSVLKVIAARPMTEHEEQWYTHHSNKG